MFDDPRFDNYEPERFPLNRDALLVDIRYAKDYEAAYLALFDGGPSPDVGYISHVSVRSVSETNLDLSWYPNIFDRFHEVPISLPRNQLSYCVGCGRWDWEPTLFVDSEWLSTLHAKTFSVFGIVDAIGIREAVRSHKLSRSMLLQLRCAVDTLGVAYPDIAFVSFADSILVKSNWTVGSVHNDLTYTYRPERFIALAKDLRALLRESLDTDCYAILTQGYNEYYADDLLYISKSQNHISLNSIGLPFAQLMAIEKAVRAALRGRQHAPAQIYLEETFYHSLRFRLEYDKNRRPKAPYLEPFRGQEAHYFFADIDALLQALEHGTT